MILPFNVYKGLRNGNKIPTKNGKNSLEHGLKENVLIYIIKGIVKGIPKTNTYIRIFKCQDYASNQYSY